LNFDKILVFNYAYELSSLDDRQLLNDLKQCQISLLLRNLLLLETLILVTPTLRPLYPPLVKDITSFLISFGILPAILINHIGTNKTSQKSFIIIKTYCYFLLLLI